MSNRLPVIAAIPTYQMADHLSDLLPDVLEQGYDSVYVLDDHSIDHTRDVVAEFGHDVQLITGDTNVGSGANRNRILGVLDDLRETALTHFLDADVTPETINMPTIASDAYSEHTGLMGGLVYDESGQQSPWNYGPRQCFFTDLGGFSQSTIEQFRAAHPKAARSARHVLHGLMEDWPDPAQPPVARNTYWVLEANMLVRSDHLAKVGGFDPAIREHDIQDVAIRLQKLGLVSVFEPRIAVTQHAVGIRDYDRNRARMQAEWHIARKNGLLQWFFPDGRLKPRYNQ